MWILLVLITNISLANNTTSDKRIYQCLDTVPVSLDAKAKKIDSNVLVVLNGKALGTIREIKNLDSIINPDNIQSIIVLKDSVATNRYGEKGKSGVIVISSKNEIKSNSKDLYLEEMKVDDNIIFTKAEVEATFPGGEKQWIKFLEGTLNPNVPVRNKAPLGTYTVVIQFVVDKSGKLSDFKAITYHGYGMEEECIRVLKLSPNWLPAIQNGRNVKAYRKQPITFMISK